MASDDANFRGWYLYRLISICNNLSRTNVSMLDNHTCVSIRQCIVDYLRKENLPSTIPSQSSETQTEIFHSKFCREIGKRSYKCNENVSYGNVAIITAVQWSDDFDPSSMCKNNWGSV